MLRLLRLSVILLTYNVVQTEQRTFENAFSKIIKANSDYARYQDQHQFYQGDIKVPRTQNRHRVSRAATSDQSKLWPNGVIPYRIAASITRRPEHAKLLTGAIAEWQRKTCLQFIKRTTQLNYVEFYYGEGCNSDVGVMMIGRQTTSVGKGCEDHAIMVHEIGHLIGLYHEQNREDRDQHVKIIWDNVHPKYFYAFEKKDSNEIDSRGVEYDYYSVMHYGSKDFSKNSKPTIVSKKRGVTEFGNDHISPLDAKVVNLMYNCPELIKFPRDFYWRHYGLSRRDTDCIQVNEPKDPNSWNNNYLCRRRGKMPIGLMWSHNGPIKGMSCVKAVIPPKNGKNSWDDNFFCWPSDSVYKFKWKTTIPKPRERRSCLKITEPRDRVWSRSRYYLCGKKDESPVDGGWSDWTAWSRCSRQCGGGIHRRVRACNNPSPAYGGKYCMGLTYETGKCGTKSCGNWPVFPDDFVYKEFIFPPDNKLCLRTYERFDYFTWGGYLFCTPDDMKDPLFDWSDSGPLTGMKCTNIYNPIENLYRRNTWNNNHLCVPKDSPYSFEWSRKGPLKGKACLRWRPKNGKDGWDNSWLCNTHSKPLPIGGQRQNPIHGGWTTWSGWSRCTRTCAGGFQKRERKCTNPAPRHGGRTCDGLGLEKRRCNIQRCAVDGEWTYWSSWGQCTNPCGGGEQTRTRTCTNPAPQNGGEKCPGIGSERRRCNDQRCPTHGGWSSWSWWGRCSKTCAGGKQARSRTCTKPRPRDGGRMCLGSHVQTRDCNTRGCPIDGQWASWSSWRACSKSCSGGIQVRTRSCTNPSPQNGGRACYDRNKEERRCNTTPCPIHGGWSRWSSWQACSRTCSGGTQQRMRTCTNPIPRHGGSSCFGDQTKNRKCGSRACPQPSVHGKWSSWSSWKPCTKTCAGGIQQRIRTCTNPTPQNGGRKCYGRGTIDRRCNTMTCPTDGKWSAWSSWKACSRSCGGGTQQRTRSCTNPAPRNGGRNCYGNTYQQRSCNRQSCRIDGKWSAWATWKACSRSCGGGTQQRTRSCTNPAPRNGGRNCYGNTYQQRSCNRHSCRIDGKWSSWTPWKACSRSCGGGTQQRTRSCTNPAPRNGGRNCYGNTYQQRSCNRQSCRIDGKWSAWSSWKACSRSCGGGTQQRTRSCTNPAPRNGGRNCYGNKYEQRSCNRQSCRIDGKWSAWSSWKACSRSCGGGTQQRTRSCTNPAPRNGGRNCYGNTYQQRSCNRQSCRIDGKWSSWSSWKACSRSCGSGTQQRTRSCTNPAPRNGGRNCYGNTYEQRSCNRHSCRTRVDGKWSSWTPWKACSRSCDGGTQQRTRSCTNPAPRNGGRNCYGNTYEQRSCNRQSCITRVASYWAAWADWSTCSRSCGRGSQRRIRTCMQDSRGQPCPGKNYQDRRCNTNIACPSQWSRWGACGASCGGGVQKRTRVCRGLCKATTVETRICNTAQCPAACGATQTGYSGRVRSPDYPRTYPPNKDCTWIIRAPANHNIKLSIRSFEIENGGAGCPRDYLEIRDGPSSSSRLIAKYCGRQSAKSLTSTGSHMWIKFHTNHRIGYKGFAAKWRAGNVPSIEAKALKGLKSDEGACGGRISKNYGSLTSPGYPRAYPPGADCQWVITASQGRRIRFWFTHFDVYSKDWCRYDYVSLRDGESRRSSSLGRHCGNRSPAPGPFTTTSNGFLVRFRTGEHNQQRTGFQLIWTSFTSRQPISGRGKKTKMKEKADCDVGWVTRQAPTGSYCYLVTKPYLPWVKAKIRCNHWKADLLTLESKAEQDFIRASVLKYSYIWLGFSDAMQEGKWVWDNSYVKTLNSYTNWGPGEPSDGGANGRENCAVMKPSGVWNDFPCDFKFRFICKKRGRKAVRQKNR